jgi:hypothetical protein
MTVDLLCPVPYLVCCGLLLPWKAFDGAWCASCGRCGRDFAYSDPDLTGSEIPDESEQGVVS